MRDNEGFDILVNNVPRTFRDLKSTAYAAASILKSKSKSDIIEIVDRSSGQKVMMLEDGRTA